MEKRYNKTVLHLPERLAEQLNYLSLYPITVIEAPSGFGKTTALRECFKKSRQEKSFAVWYTFSGTDDHMSWVEFCSLLKEINPQTAEALCKCGVPSMEMMDEIFPLIENTIFFDDTYLIIDNYQNISKSFRQCITRHLLQNKNHKLHYIIITRQADAELCNLYLTNKILYIGAAYFLFDKADIMAYYKKIGISLTAAETGRLKKSTGGWIKA
ncbi:MAG: hypothetical protein EOM14_14055, partial [Clostridia bacterium]|nr:hypothetical protein [Clostridia bacterium]